MFNLHYARSPQGDSTLYYLYGCYQKLGQNDKSMEILEQLAERDCLDKNVYFSLFCYYEGQGEYRRQYELFLNANPVIQKQLDGQYQLTRRIFAGLLTGATSRVPMRDPAGYVLSRGFMSAFPDGQFYGQDTLTTANLIVMLDRLVSPVYPQKLYVVKNISARSFLYIPYMRLVEQGILPMDPEIDPEKRASISMAVKAISSLISRGILH